MTREILVALLMRVFVAEAGWSSEADHAAIGHVLLRQAERQGVTLEVVVQTMVDRHSRALARHPWLLSLGPDCEAPVDWPESRRWLPVSCSLLADRAYRLLRGEVRDPCPRAQQWRARRSLALRRALRAGYRRIGCGRTENAFLEEPKR
jgi:hypothetical protein